MTMPAERATATQWIRWLVEPPVASSATIALTIERSSTSRPIGRKRASPPAAACGHDAFARTSRTASLRQRVAQAVVRMDEGRAGHVQAHRLEQHLVAVGGAVEGAGAGAVVRRRLGLHAARRDRRGRARTARAPRVFSALARPLPIGPPGTKTHGRWPKWSAPMSRPGHDLVADAEQQRRVEDVVRERDRRAHRDRVAREQAHLHAGQALRDAVAHRRHAAGDLRGRAERVRRVADDRPGSARTAGAPRACRCRR